MSQIPLSIVSFTGSPYLEDLYVVVARLGPIGAKTGLLLQRFQMSSLIDIRHCLIVSKEKIACPVNTNRTIVVKFGPHMIGRYLQVVCVWSWG